MKEKLKRIYSRPLVQQFRDIRFVMFCVLGVIFLIVSWSSVGVIQTNYKLQQQISALQQQNAVYELQNKNLGLSNQYYNTDQYLELQARRQFGKAAPGETVFLVPKNVALSHTINTDAAANPSVKEHIVNKSIYQRNFEAWMNFFIRHQRNPQ